MNLDGHGGTAQVNLTVSLVLATCTLLLAIFAWPETLHESQKSKSVLDGERVEQYESGEEEEIQKKTSKLGAIRNLIYKPFTNFAESVSGIGVMNITLLALSTCFAATGIKAIDWWAIILYPVIKLHWTFPQASKIVSIQGFLMLLHFFLILPMLNRFAARHLGSASHGHFAIMAGSSLLLTIGAVLMGFSTTTPAFIAGVVIYLFGEGLPTATQAFIVSLVEKSKVARVMATLSMTSIFGKLAASLLFPKILALGLDTHKDVLVGLPSFVSAGLFVVSATCFSLVGMRMWGSRGKKDVEV